MLEIIFADLIVIIGGKKFELVLCILSIILGITRRINNKSRIYNTAVGDYCNRILRKTPLRMDSSCDASTNPVAVT